MATYRRNQDLISIGAYPQGSSVAIDRAIGLHEPLKKFLRQGIEQGFNSAESWRLLSETMKTPPSPPRNAK
jgi:flagellum-specific ATP synthase